MNLREKTSAMHPGSLFRKITCVVVLGVLAISAFTLVAARNMTRQGYIETMNYSNRQIMAMVQAKMEAMNDRITDVELTINNSWAFSQYLKTEPENPRTFTLVYDMIKQLDTVKPDTFYDVAVVGLNEQSYVSNQSSLSISVKELLGSRITQEAREHPNRILYRYVPQGITKNSKGSSAFIALKALASPGSQAVYGFVYVVMTQRDLQAFFDNLGNSTNNLMLLDESGTVVSSPNHSLVGQKDEELKQIIRDMDSHKENSRYTTLQNKPVLMLTRTMPRWNLHIVSAFDYIRALNEMQGSAYILLVCLAVTALVLAAVFIFISQITRPINKLVHTMDKVTEKGLPDHVEVIQGGYEVQQLSKAFHIMIEHLNRYMRQLIELEREKRRMEIHTLQMQINPHFIYNTLTSIKWLIWQKDSEKAIRSIDTFSMLLHSTIGGSRSLIPASEEVENLKNYIFLQKIRFGQQIQANIYLSPSASGCQIPKLLLQPFLENSFFHAFADRKRGVISVLIDCHNESLCCEIIDDGVGMPQSKADRLLTARPDEDSYSIGIRNVNARVHLLFGERYGVKIFSEPGHGTSVKVTLPVIRKGSDTSE